MGFKTNKHGDVYKEKSSKGHSGSSPGNNDGSSSYSRDGPKKTHPDGTETDYQIGDKVMVDSEHEDNYPDFKNKVLIVTHVAVDTNDHPGYDDGVAGQGLYDFKLENGKSVGSSLYDYELVSA
ncbi:MAG: hypothetical protein HOD60_14985 [Candidatus Nitrosopelagicus sp.]|nr:hypothetical protein [Candidatus Nitrosopelagicus sp.]